MIGSVFSIPSLLDSVEEETVNDMLQTFSCVSEGVQLNKVITEEGTADRRLTQSNV